MVACLLMAIPFLGYPVVAAFLIFGSGIVMTTRFGTNKQWLTRKARYWGA